MSEAKPWSRDLPPGRPGAGGWDTIVIGSGMGGMTCAAMLARAGQRVLVLEQHYVPGGFTHAFKRPGYEWDVGVHAVGEVTRHTLTGRLLDHLSGGALRWASLGAAYDRFDFPDGVKIDFPDSPAAFRENLIEAFPGEEAAISGYLRQVREVAGAMRSYYMARLLPAKSGQIAELLLAGAAQRAFKTSTKSVLDSLTPNPRLKAVLASQWGYYGAPPSRSSFAIQALVCKHFMHGAYYPIGGSKMIARTLLQTVADAGGWTRIRADVRSIVIEAGRAVGVKMADGEVIKARRVISAAGAIATATRLLPESARSASWARSIAGLRPAPAHVCLYLGFRGDVRAAGAGAANRWFYETWDNEIESWAIEGEGPPPPAPVLYCSFPSLKDPLHEAGPGSRHTGEVVTFVPWERFAAWSGSRWQRRGEDYEALKERLKARLLAQFSEKMPALAPLIDHAELSTPLSTEHFVRPSRGSIYGIEPTPARFQNQHLRPRTPIPGLLMAGSDVATVGVIGAMMGGVLAAAAAEPGEMFSMIRALA
jgi:all-trans-retinol 13,14-reductase